MHLFRIWFQRLPDIRNFAVYFLALWPMFQLIPALRENSCAKPVLRANLWVKFWYSRIGFFGVWNLSWHKEMKSRGLSQNRHFHTTLVQLNDNQLRFQIYLKNE